jgi:addiction module HigA family antidote
MVAKKKYSRRKPSHPGMILDELYIKPLNLNLEMLAERLLIARNTLFKIRSGKASITPAIALSLAEAFDTTPQLWLNLQQNYDLWIEEHEHVRIQPILKNGELLPIRQNIRMMRRSTNAYR